jgi:predicted nucleotidyltransferase
MNTNPENTILKILENIETEHNVIILYAVEAGSRAWGYHADHSDDDVRFIYIHREPHWYMKLTQKPIETIQYIDKDTDIDCAGWDINKAIRHAKESNPSLIEYLSTPIIYIDKLGFADELRKIVSQMHTALSLSFHYKSMAASNWHTWIENKTIVIKKKYFYIVRPIGMLHWVLLYPDRPLVVDFHQILEDLKPHLKLETYNVITQLFQLKRETKMEETLRIKQLDDYYQEVIEMFESKVEKKKPEEINVQSVAKLYANLKNHYRKINKITTKHGSINRSEYLSCSGHALQFLWLKQHPDKNGCHIPPKIGVLLRETQVPEEIYKIIHEIIMKDELEKSGEISETVEKVLKVAEKDRRIPTTTWNQFFRNLITNYQEMVQSPLNISISPLKELMEGKLEKIVRDDIIDFWMKKQMMELIWMLENPDQSMGHIPKQPHTLIKSTTSDFKEKLQELIEEGKTKFMMNIPELNDWFNSLIEENQEFVNQVHQMKQRLKEEQAHRNYQHSMKKLDPQIFDDLFIKYVTMEKYN